MFLKSRTQVDSVPDKWQMTSPNWVRNRNKSPKGHKTKTQTCGVKLCLKRRVPIKNTAASGNQTHDEVTCRMSCASVLHGLNMCKTVSTHLLFYPPNSLENFLKTHKRLVQLGLHQTPPGKHFTTHHLLFRHHLCPISWILMHVRRYDNFLQVQHTIHKPKLKSLKHNCREIMSDSSKKCLSHSRGSPGFKNFPASHKSIKPWPHRQVEAIGASHSADATHARPIAWQEGTGW